MAEKNDTAYLMAREADARDLARESKDLSVRKAHLDMAEGYAERIRAVKPDQPV